MHMQILTCLEWFKWLPLLCGKSSLDTFLKIELDPVILPKLLIRTKLWSLPVCFSIWLQSYKLMFPIFLSFPDLVSLKNNIWLPRFLLEL